MSYKEWHIPKIDFAHYYDAAGKYKNPSPDKVHVIEFSAYQQAVELAEKWIIEAETAFVRLDDYDMAERASEALELVKEWKERG